MDDQQLRILDDLRDVVSGDVLVDDITLAAYSTDASILQVRPLAVVAPRSASELAGIVKYAHETGLSLHPRGAGTGLAGESLGPGIMVDTSRYMNRILEIGEDRVRVEPGVRWSDLARTLAKQGRMFAPDPVSGDRCTIGGMLMTDAAGPHSLRYGTTRDYASKLAVVLANGETVEVGKANLGEIQKIESQRLGEIVGGIADVVSEYADAIDEEQPAHLRKHGGYHLRGVVAEGTVDVARLLVGSEGTLAIVAEAELSTLPIPPHRGMLLACFSTLESAAHAVLESLEYMPSACEMLDRRLLTLIKGNHPRYTRWIPDDAEALLVIEQEGASEENVRERLLLMSNRLNRVKRLASETLLIQQTRELERVWELRNLASPKLGDVGGNDKPIAFVENTMVPPENLPELLTRVQNIMKRHEVTASYASHAGVGVLHTRPLLDLRRPDHRAKLEVISREVLAAALSCGGTNNGEHGVGLLRTNLLERQYPKLHSAFKKIKALFDPHNRLNPGKIVGGEPNFPLRYLRVPESVIEDQWKPQLRWSELSIIDTAERCNGCSDCQTTRVERRMCPSFKVFQSEMSGPRSKANLMRQIAFGGLDPKLLSSHEFRKVADYCVNCKMCKVECPSSVDISKLMLEAKVANVAEEGLSRSDWYFANLESWSRWSSSNALLINRLIGNRGFRWLAERIWGLSRHRMLPKFHHRTFLRRASKHGWTKKPRSTESRARVAFFADVFVNYNDPQLGEYAVRVLEHHRRKVYVPPTQRASGMAAIQQGDLDTAKACLQWNLEIFAELAREGYDIVCPEPSAALMFRDEARNLISDPDLDLVAAKTYEFSEYLAVLNERGELREELSPVPLSVAYHEPCHVRALLPRGSVSRLLRRIPELRLVTMDLGCSGMAGTFGLSSQGFDTSLKAGAPMLERLSQSDIHFGVTQCAACRMQMEQGGGKRVLHPAKWFALAYGMVQRPEHLFDSPGKGLVLS
ncbi:MAG: FAD-linked oxidase C-terminal domain-containing protein [Planctomycetota bacterium]